MHRRPHPWERGGGREPGLTFASIYLGTWTVMGCASDRSAELLLVLLGALHVFAVIGSGASLAAFLTPNSEPPGLFLDCAARCEYISALLTWREGAGRLGRVLGLLSPPGAISGTRALRAPLAAAERSCSAASRRCRWPGRYLPASSSRCAGPVPPSPALGVVAPIPCDAGGSPDVPTDRATGGLRPRLFDGRLAMCVSITVCGDEYLVR